METSQVVDQAIGVDQANSSERPSLSENDRFDGGIGAKDQLIKGRARQAGDGTALTGSWQPKKFG